MVTRPIPQQVDAFVSNVRFPWAQGYNIRVDTRWFRTVEGPDTQIQLGTRDSLAERMDRAGSVYENVLDIGYSWARTDLSGGEGLDWDPRQLALDQDKAALDQTRYWDSSGIDVRRPDTAGVPYALRLSHSREVWKAQFVAPVDMGVSEKNIYVADGEEVQVFYSWLSVTPDETYTPSAGDDIIAIAVAPNDTVLVTLENGQGWIKRSIDSNFTKAYTPSGGNKYDARGCWYVNGRFLLSAFDDIDQAQLFPIEWDGTDWEPEDPMDTASSPFWSVVESGPVIVAAVGDGTVRTYAPTGQGDMTLIPYARTTMPSGETPFLLGSNAGVLLVMTSSNKPLSTREELRIYQAEVLDDRYNFSVGQMQLRREWLAVEHEPLVTRNMTTTRDEILWFVKEEIEHADEDDNTLFLESLWRFDVVTNGLSRVYTVDPVKAGAQIDLNAIVNFDDIHAGIDFNNKNVVLADPSGFQPFGWMIFPNITFGVNTDITWLTTVIEAQNLAESGAQIELYQSTDPGAILDWKSSSWKLMQRLSAGGESSIEHQLTNLKSRTISLQVRVAASADATKSPAITRIAIRGIPAHRDFIMLVPFNVSDYVTAPRRRPKRHPGLGQFLHDQVLGMVGDSVEASIIKPGVLFRGIVNNVSEPVEVMTERGSVTRYAIVEFRGERLTTLPYPTGDAGVGLGLLGIAIVGVGQTEQE